MEGQMNKLLDRCKWGEWVVRWILNFIYHHHFLLISIIIGWWDHICDQIQVSG